MGRDSAAETASADLMVRLAASIDAAAARRGALQPEAAAERLVRHLAARAAENDLGGLVEFFSNGLGLVRDELDRAAPARRGFVETAPAEPDSSYWLG